MDMIDKYNLPSAERPRQDLQDSKVGLLLTETLEGTAAATAANYGVFFTAVFPVEVAAVAATFKTAGSNGSAVTLNLEVLTSGQALDAGTAVLREDFNLKGTINTPVTKSGSDLTQNRVLNPGDRLALKDTGTLTDVEALSITVYLFPRFRGSYA